MVAATSTSGHSSGFSAPDTEPTTDPELFVGQRSRALRAWLTQVVCGAALPSLLLVLPLTLYPTVDLVGTAIVLTALVVACAGFILARSDHADVAAGLLVTGAVLVVTMEIANLGLLGNGLDIAHITLLDRYIVPSVLAAVLLRRKVALAVTACCSALMVAELIVLPRTPLLSAFWNHQSPYPNGSALDALLLPLTLNWLTTALVHVAVIAMQRGMLDAARADELARANERIRAQWREITQQRRLVLEGAKQIQTAYAAVQRGDLSARVASPSPDLIPIALSFNLLLDRLDRLSQENARYRRRLERERERVPPSAPLAGVP